MSDGLTLTEFLLARYAELERVARDIIERRGHLVDELETGPPWFCDEQSSHVATAPAFILADVEAKRRIVETLALPYIAERRRLMNGQPSWADEHPDLLLLLALPYADHPDYREEEWKP